MQTFLIIVGVVLLFLAYRKLDALFKLFEEEKIIKEGVRKQQEYQDTNFHNWLYKDLENLKEKIVELSDVYTVNNPAWGKDSAASKKQQNLIGLYVEHLVEKEKLSQKDAFVKAQFVVNNFEGGIVDDMLREIHLHEEAKSEEELLNSDFFKKEVETEANSLSAKDIFEPLWVGIKHREYKKGDEFLQNTRKVFESHSGVWGYESYVSDSAIIDKLEKLGILGLKENNDGIKKTMSGHPWYVLKEDDLEKLRHMIFADDEQGKQYYDDAYFADQHPKDERFDMPFTKLFEYL